MRLLSCRHQQGLVWEQATSDARNPTTKISTSLRRRTEDGYLDVEQRREEELGAEHLVVAELPDPAGRGVADPLGHVAVAPGLHDAHAAVVALDVGPARRAVPLRLGAADAAGHGEVVVQPREHGVLEHLGGEAVPGPVVVHPAQVVQLEGQVRVRQRVVHLPRHRARHHRGEPVPVHRARRHRLLLMLLEHHAAFLVLYSAPAPGVSS
uniref:Uncharacterized protein n=1 Tax=Zea mays TaxID=4577 RepID=C4J3N4_MAIZE|nr:unknown [Zea mays]